MPVARFEMPDGRIGRFEVPEGTTPEQAQALIAQSMSQQKPAQEISRTEKIATGMADPIHGGAQLLTQSLPANVVQAGNRLNNWLADKTGLVAKLPEGGVDQQVREREAAYQAQRSAAGESGFDGYRMIGNVASPANIAISRLLPGLGAPMLTKMAVGAAGGAASAALSPVTEGDFAAEKKKQIGIGAAAGGATPLVVSGVSRVISPKASVNPDVKMLRSEGVKPTIGQTLGGTFNAVEEKATSLPLVGDAIAYNRRRAVEQFNNAAINRATAPIGKRVDGSGVDAVRKAGDLVSDAYDAAKSQLGAFKIDAQANGELNKLRMLASSGLEGRERATFNKYFADYIGGNKALTADKFKEFDSKLTKDIASFSASSDAYQQKLGDALKEVQRIITENAKRANPDAAKALAAADKAYANLVRVEGAAVGGKLADGVFTPGQLMTAVRGADKTVRDRATARGTALMQDLASAGQNVLGNRVPDSGTAGRVFMGGGLGAAAYADPMLTGALTGSGLLAYTPAVQSLLRGAVASRPELAQPVAQAFKKTSPYLVPAGAQVGLGLLQN